MNVFSEHTIERLEDMSSGLVAVETEEGDGLMIYFEGRYLGTVGLGTYRLFRPDHDAYLVSPHGRAWRPA